MIKWFGTVTSIIGAFLVASQLIFIGYIMFICGSISWLIIGMRAKDNAMITLNGVFFLANLLGLYNAY
jgi:hypothetical protein